MNKKKYYNIIIIILLFFIFVKSPFYYIIRSYIIMYPYSLKMTKESIIQKKDIYIYIPSGRYTKEKDWYPFVLTFNDNKGFSRYIGKNLSVTVLYNFGHFILREGSSSYYNPNSKYYNSFYGAYIIYNNDNPKSPFGFNEDGSINIDEISLIPKYDQERLVLPSLGCPSNIMVFKNNIESIENDVKYLNIDGWTKIDSEIITNSPIHKYKKSQIGYIQYGKPIEKYYNNKDFPIIKLKGRAYVNYLEKYDVTIIMYIMSPNNLAIEECDKNILSKSTIK